MSPDPMTLLREADPAGDERPDPVESEALLRRVLAMPPAAPPSTRPRRRWALVPAGAACLLIAASALALLPRPGPAERAYAAVTPGEEILHVESTKLYRVEKDSLLVPAPPGDSRARYRQRTAEGLTPAYRQETWETADPSRKRFTLAALRAGEEEITVYESASSPQGGRVFLPASSEILVSSSPTAPAGELTAVETFRRLYRGGEVTERGEVTVDGRKLVRLSTSTGRRIDWLVDPDSYEPVVVRRYDETGRIVQEEERITVERIPLEGETERLLELSPHPGAEVVREDG